MPPTSYSDMEIYIRLLYSHFEKLFNPSIDSSHWCLLSRAKTEAKETFEEGYKDNKLSAN